MNRAGRTRGVNDSPSTAQPVTIGTDGKVVIDGGSDHGTTSLNALPDVDFYSFEGRIATV